MRTNAHRLPPLVLLLAASALISNLTLLRVLLFGW
jgi:hypothetical protein